MKRSAFGAILAAAAVGVLMASPASAKTAKECRAEWSAHKADYKAKGITQKDYVAKCRAEGEKPKAAKQTSQEKAAAKKESKAEKAAAKKAAKERAKEKAKEKAPRKSPSKRAEPRRTRRPNARPRKRARRPLPARKR